jgi:TPR repeat protein
MCRRVAFVGAVLALSLTTINGAHAAAADKEQAYHSPIAAYDEGMAALRAGRAKEAIPALVFAAGKGLLDAQLRLAELYAQGLGVEKSEAKSFNYYQRIATQFADAGPRHPVAAQIAEAYSALAGYYRSGVAEFNIKPDPARAAALYRHAASFFGSVDAQYNLARMYLSGEGVNKNVRIAVNWLANAARKQHAPSQALLGDLLWRGVSDGYHQPLKGLALLSVARVHAEGTPDAAWIGELYERAVAEAQPEQREIADMLASHWNPGQGSGRAKSRPLNPPVRSLAPAGVAASGIRTVGAAQDLPAR